jgi:hypothetical protein
MTSCSIVLLADNDALLVFPFVYEDSHPAASFLQVPHLH